MDSPWSRAILHVDMDAFFAAVEQRDNPELRGKPVIIGGSAKTRGVVSTASYEARVFGIHSAMPSRRAHKLCPQGIFLRGRMSRYQEVSRIVREIFFRFTPAVEPLSIDEAFLDITGSQTLLGSPLSIAKKVKETILAETELTASVGLAPTKFVAKIASDFEKPAGLVVVREGEVLDFLAPLPVSRIWGVGKVMAKKLAGLGIHTITDLRGWSEVVLAEQFGSQGAHLYRLARGIDVRNVQQRPAEKSISNETTFATDIVDWATLTHALLRLADNVAARVRAQDLRGRVVQLKVRYGDFSTVTRRRTLPEGICTAHEIHHTALDLLKHKTAAGQRPIRLVGVGLSGFQVPATQSGNLFAALENAADEKSTKNNAKNEEMIERTTDAIRKKLGRNAIGRASIFLADDGHAGRK